jgi:hypothetical protein
MINPFNHYLPQSYDTIFQTNDRRAQA